MSRLRLPRRRLTQIIGLVLVLLAAGGVYFFVLASPAAEPKPKVEGQVYVLPKEFLINLADERFAKLSVGLVLEESQEAVAGEGGEAAPSPPEGFGPLPQEALVRDLITGTVTAMTADELIDRTPREALKRRIARTLRSRTDVKVKSVLFTDLAVQ